MAENNTSKLDRMGKRRFLKTLAGFGVSGTTLRWITPEAAAEQTEDLKKKIPYVEAYRNSAEKKREPVFGSIERDRWVKTKAGEQAAQRLKKQLQKSLDVSGIYVANRNVRGEEELIVKYTKKQNRNRTGTTLTAASKSELERNLPPKITGRFEASEINEEVEFPVVLKEETRIEQGYYSHDYQPVPGGVEMDPCSSGCRADVDSEYVMMTAGHCLNGRTEDVYQPENGEVIGTVDTFVFWKQDDQHDVTDFGYFSSDGDTTFTDFIGSNNGDNSYKSNPVTGTVSWDWISTDGYSSTVTRQGKTTGTRSGQIVDHENDRGQKAFWNQANSKGGDSGGPHYTFIDGNRYIVGIHAWGVDVGSTPDDDGIRSGGNSAEKIENETGAFIY